MIEIYQWDVIDIKMKEHLSNNQFQLYSKLKNSRTLSRQSQISSDQKLSKKQPRKFNDLPFSFIDKNNSRIKQRPCLQLKAKQHNQMLTLNKNQNSISIHQILAIRQYTQHINQTNSVSITKKQIPKTYNLHRISYNHLKPHKKTYSQVISLKKPKPSKSIKSTKKSHKSLTKKQKNTKQQFVLDFMTVNKVSFSHKNASKQQNPSQQRRSYLQIKGNQQMVSLENPHASEETKKLMENVEFKSLSTRPKTAEALCHQKNLNLRNFLDLGGVHKKPLKL